MKKLFLILGGVYLAILAILYFGQEWVIFRAAPLPPDYQFHFDQPFKERFIQAPDGTQISTLLFKAQGKSKGLVFNNHGNRRNISRWGRTADQFTSHGYDVFFYDYRGFGKTKGKPSEEKIHEDAEFLFNEMKNKYDENEIIIYGRSLGTGIATRLAANHHPKMLILESPYYNMADVGYMHFPLFPYSLIIKHPFRTDKWIGKVACPVHIFHGTDDELIPYESSVKLAEKLHRPRGEVLTLLKGGGHRGLNRFDAYQKKMSDLLAQ